MANSINNYIRTTLGSLCQATAHLTKHIASGLGSAYKVTASNFRHKTSIAIPTKPLEGTHLFIREISEGVSLHPKAEQGLREEYTRAFSQLLKISTDSAPSVEKDIYSLILEVMETFNPRHLSPLAIIRFREVLNLQLEKLGAILLDRPTEKDTLQKKGKYDDRLKLILKQLSILRDLLKKSTLTAPSVNDSGGDALFAQQVSELALVIKIKTERRLT